MHFYIKQYTFIKNGFNMIKGLRLAFVEELRCFGRRVREIFRNVGIYTCEQSQINKITPNKIQINTKLALTARGGF